MRPAALGLALGLLRGSFQEPPRTPALPAEFEGRVVAAAGERATVRVQGALVDLNLRGLPVHRGDVAIFSGRVHEPPPALNPGGRDRRAALLARGVGLEGSAEVLQVLQRGPRLWSWLDDLRDRFAARAAGICAPEQAALLTALAVGNRRGISAAEEEELSASGLVHLLASSGLHLFIIAWLTRESVRRLWLRTPWASAIRAAAAGACVALPFAAAEVLLLGAPWPAVRAGVALAVGLLAASLARRPDGPTTLLFAAACCALADPAATHDLALQLSVAGIGGLLLLARPLRELLPVPLPPLGASLWRRGLEHFLQIACSTAAAALITAPLLAASFHRLSLVSVAANALALLPGLAAIPLATALVFFDSLPLWWLADLLATITLRAAHFFSALPFATIAVASPGILVCLLWYAGVALVSRRSRKSLACFSVLGVLGLSHSLLARFEDGVKVTFLAVGQGDCSLIQLPGGHALLIDAGGDLRWPARFDPGTHDVLPALAELGISRLDLVVLTHPHPDHAGGLLSVIDHVPIGELWMNEEVNPISTAVRARAAQRGVPVREPRSETLAGARLALLSHFEPGRSTNDNSIVLRVSYGSDAALFAGDAEALAESELAQQDLRADLLKAPHHGSRTSSTDSFLRKVSPRFTVYQTGAGNPFGFPMPDVVSRTPGEHFNTATGAVIATSSGHGWTVQRWHD
ncbi:MAG TPA: DNA internalization-related competence protein ComEC/Rec2 [Myxococcales bacterium]|jgi:competence protein ComEC|nr:DNA internalization-related competence protein ComEC/Rec2 [Myxococcales bacterium]